jgi:hypothetical protein
MAMMPHGDVIAITMTAELCDCFATKAAGVHAVLDAVEAATREIKPCPRIQVWLSDGSLVSPVQARAEPIKAAASNWLALATWAARDCPEGPGLVIDVGSTTTDLVPLDAGRPEPQGRSDLDRLACGELVYSGVRRTPVCALLRSIEIRSRRHRVASELFATTLDVYLTLGELPEQPERCDTADGRPATREYARSRLARVVCADSTMLADSATESIARQVSESQMSDLLDALRQVSGRLHGSPRRIVLAGTGEFLARRLVQRACLSGSVVSLAEIYGPAISAAACAFALARLCGQQLEECGDR